MSKANIIRGWKDEAYRLSLSAEQRALMPANPAGAIELEDAQLDDVSGGASEGPYRPITVPSVCHPK